MNIWPTRAGLLVNETVTGIWPLRGRGGVLNETTVAGPTINTQPSNQTVTSPATATFSVTATASGGSLTYQWKRNTVAISGATSSSFTTGPTTVSGGTDNNGDSITVDVTDSNGTITSNAATLTVNPSVGSGGIRIMFGGMF